MAEQTFKSPFADLFGPQQPQARPDFLPPPIVSPVFGPIGIGAGVQQPQARPDFLPPPIVSPVFGPIGMGAGVQQRTPGVEQYLEQMREYLNLTPGLKFASDHEEAQQKLESDLASLASASQEPPLVEAAPVQQQQSPPGLSPQDWALIQQMIQQQQLPATPPMPSMPTAAMAPQQQMQQQQPPLSLAPQEPPSQGPNMTDDYLASLNASVAQQNSPMLNLLASMAMDLDQPRRRRGDMELLPFQDYASQWRDYRG